MLTIQDISISLSIPPHNINEYFNDHVQELCTQKLVKHIYNNVYIVSIINSYTSKDKFINHDGSIKLHCVCKCNIIDIVLHSEMDIVINDINKMGASYKIHKLCIFIPRHLACSRKFFINDTVRIKIIGKRVEEDIVCIAQPI